MKLPDIPTDNLYKFLSIFGLIIFLFTSYWLLAFDYHEIRSGKIIIIIFLSMFWLVGLVLTYKGFKLWYKKTQSKLDQILENETKKYEADKELYIHKFKFDKEMELYKNLWQPLVEIKDNVEKLNVWYKTFMKKYKDKDEDLSGLISEYEYQEKVRNKFKEEINPKIKEFKDILHKNQPFIPKNVFKDFDNLRDFFNEIKTHSLFAPNISDLKETAGFEQDDKLPFSDKLNNEIDKLAETIRKRKYDIEIKD